jgi:hypothetical protein
VFGTGNVILECQSGLQLQSASFGLSLAGNLKKEVGIVDAIPQLVALESEPFIGGIIQWFNRRATLTGEIEPSLTFATTFQQDALGNLKFDQSAGTLGLNLKATLQVNSGNERLSASAWVAGSGSTTLSVPGSPFVRTFEVTLEAGVALRLDYIIKVGLEAKADYSCTWTPGTGTICGSSDGNGDGSFSLINHDYAQFGEYARFFPLPQVENREISRGPETTSTSGTPVPGTTLVSNLFPGASPAIIEVGNGARLLLWVHADTSLPVTQGTGIMWSFIAAQGTWSEPKLIVQDTRAEFSPVVGVDGNGKVIAAWLRVKDANFSASIDKAEDVARFYKDFEVVTADFDPATQTWTNVSTLTDDSALDTDLELSSDGTGGLLLSWLSNPDAELMSTVQSPSMLNYSNRTGGAWSPPVALATSLVGVNKHTAAVHGQEAFIIMSRDPDPGANDDGVLDIYRRKNGVWGAAETFAAGGVENRLPAVAYDSAGKGNVVWLRGEDLVSATLDDSTPHLVRSGSTGLGFYDTRLIANRQGNLALIYQQPVQDGSANLFASFYFPTSNTWGEGQQLVDETRQSRNPSAYFDREGQLDLAYLATDIQRRTRTVTINGVEYVVDNIPQEGQTDLKTATIGTSTLFAKSTLGNISTRMHVGTGDDAMIGGFIITGTQKKAVIVRGIGPSLEAFGIQGALADPQIEIHDSSGQLIAFNDNWREDVNSQEVINYNIEPQSELEAALWGVMDPGAYTVVVRGTDDSSGVGVFEVYDLNQTVDSKLANISTRGFVNTGDNVMIGGTIIIGSNPAKVLVRGIGPSLTNAGVLNALQDPTLELHNGNGALIASNNNWRDSQEAEIIGTTIPPTDNRESAILVNLAPGAYTAIVRGAGNSTGVAVVEAYQLQ